MLFWYSLSTERRQRLEWYHPRKERIGTDLIIARNSQFGLPGSKFIRASFSSFNSACLCLLSSRFFFSLSTSFTTFDRLTRPLSACTCCCCCCCDCSCCCFCLACDAMEALKEAAVDVGVGGMFSNSRRLVNPATESPCPFTVTPGGIMLVGRPVCRDNCLLEPAAKYTSVA